jgi:hypothetical protein
MLRIIRKFSSRLVPGTIAPLLIAGGIYLTFALWIARTKAPWFDEGMFANPAYNLAFHGYMGANVVDPGSHSLNASINGIQKRVYYVLPNHIIALAGWFRLLGFSLFSMRMYSILWGVVTLLALFYILYRLFPSPRVAQLAVLLISIDFIFLWSAADGRMEAPANALALCALAAYLHFRQDRLGTAVLLSQSLLALAVFTHLNALLVGLTIPVLAWRDDRSRIKPVHLLLAAAPYPAAAAPWVLYILQSPADFRAQFLASANGRWIASMRPWSAAWAEIIRHLETYMVGTMWSIDMSPWLVLIPLIYALSIIWLIRKWREHDAGARTFLVCAVTVLFAFTFLDGAKEWHYLHFMVPLYDAVLAAWLLNLWRRRGDASLLASVLGLAFVFLQVTTSVTHIRADEYHRNYLPAIRALEKDRAAGRTIVGTASLGFGLGFYGFTDDWRLGISSHLKPDVLVLDHSYRQFEQDAEDREPFLLTQVVTALTSTYRLSHRYGSFWVFERPPANGSLPRPWLDTSGLKLQKSGKKARYLFTLLSHAPEANTSDASRRLTAVPPPG